MAAGAKWEGNMERTGFGGVRGAGTLNKLYSESDPSFRENKELPRLLPGLGFRAVH